MPTPKDDANDGYPIKLFRNDGNQLFSEVSDSLIQGEVPARRTKKAEFHDIDADGDDDLILANHFAPLTILENSDGMFTDISRAAQNGTVNPLRANNLAFSDFDGE